MEDDFGEFVQYVEDDLLYLPMPRHILRDNENPLERYSNAELLQRYRFSRNTIQNVLLPLVYPQNVPNTQRGLPVPQLINLWAALRFYAPGSYQKTCGDLLDVSQPTVCRIITEVSEILARNVGRFVYFPRAAEEVAANRNLFFDMSGFPGVAGCIDGTHIEIKSPGGPMAEVYRNRKGWMSLNVQAIAGPRCEILDIVIRWPGSAHDSRIFHSSTVKVRFERGDLTGILLGDSAYSQLQYLYTPVQEPNTRPEQRYNYAHVRTRNAVERTFGIWKGRFRCLGTALNCSLHKTIRIIAATAVLHNIAISEREQLILEPNFLQRIVPNPPPPAARLRGNAIRAAFIQRHFENPVNQN